MLYFALAQIVQVRLPMAVLRKIICQVLGQQDVSSIAAIDDALANIDAAPGHVDLIIHIGDLIDRSAMNSHAQVDIGVLFQRLLDFQRAPDRLFRTAEENQRHPISSRHPHESLIFFRSLKTFRASHDPIQLLHLLDLLVDQ